MKTKGKIIIAMVLTIAAVLSCAAAVEIAPRWTYVTEVRGTITISSSGTATVSAFGSAWTKNVDNVKLITSLQQNKNGKWETLHSWTVDSNSRTSSLTDSTWPVSHGYSYRLYVSLDAYQGSTLLESGSFTKDYGRFD